MEDEIDLHDIFDVLWKSRLLIIGIFMIAVLVAGAISFAMPSIYRVSGIVALGNFGDPIYTGQASAQGIMQSDEFLLDINQELKLNLTPNDFSALKASIKIEPVKGTDNLLEISVESKDKQKGKDIIEGMVRLFANKSEESYNKRRKILSDQLAITWENLNVLGRDINQSREVLRNIENSSNVASVDSELRVSRMLDYLQGEESRRSSLLDHYQDLQTQLSILRPQKVVQEPKEPVSPVGPKKALIVTIAGIFGLMIGIFAAFLRDWLKRPVE